MDRGTRIALVVSFVWVLIGLALAVENKTSVPGQLSFNITVFVFGPVFIYWAYRFIRAGKPSKVNQPE